MRRATWTLLSAHAQVVEYDGDRLTLSVPTAGLLGTMQNGPHADLLRQALIDVLGVDARVDAVLAAGGEDPPASTPRARPDASPPARPQDVPRSDWSSAPPPARTAPRWSAPDPQAGAPTPDPPSVPVDMPEEDLVSADDAAVDEAADSGRAVVERLLGGTVIEEPDGS